MEQDVVPMVAVAPMADGAQSAWSVELPKGERSGELDETQAWSAVLEAVRAASTSNGELSLDGVSGVNAKAFRRGGLSAGVDGVLAELGG